jgi:hypothetical protein
MTTFLETESLGVKGLQIDMDPSNSNPMPPPSVSTPLIPHPVVNGNIPERHANGPLKEVTNTTIRPSSRRSHSSTRPLASPVTNTFKVPYQTRPRTPVERPRTPVHDGNSRRWSTSTYPQSPRRNSFPSVRKDGLEDIRLLRAEAKISRDKGLPSIVNGTPKPKTTIPQTPGENGYFTTRGQDTRNRSTTTPSVDSRGRSTTTPGGLHLPLSVRRGSYLASTPMATPRLERRQTIPADTLPTTLWDYLMLELENFEIKGVEEYKKERLRNFLQIPESLEKVYHH